LDILYRGNLTRGLIEIIWKYLTGKKAYIHIPLASIPFKPSIETIGDI